MDKKTWIFRSIGFIKIIYLVQTSECCRYIVEILLDFVLHFQSFTLAFVRFHFRLVFEPALIRSFKRVNCVIYNLDSFDIDLASNAKLGAHSYYWLLFFVGFDDSFSGAKNTSKDFDDCCCL